MIYPWEAFPNYQRIAAVLDHFDYEINTILGGVETHDGEHRDVGVMLLAGSDWALIHKHHWHVQTWCLVG